MAFLESRLDDCITQGAQRKVTQPGRRKTYVSTRLQQDFENTMPIHRYDLAHGVRDAMLRSGLTPEESYFKVLDLFYVVMFGGDGGDPYEGFRFKDWADYRGGIDNTALSLISGTTWQLQRKHTYGGVSFYRPIYKPVDGSVTVYNASNVALTGTLDEETGRWTGAGAPSYWIGEFDMPVTFTENEWSAELIIHSENLHTVMGEIALEEVRL